MRDAGDFDLRSVLAHSLRIWWRAPHVHLAMGLVLPIASVLSLGALLGPIAIGYYRYLRQLSSDAPADPLLLWSGFGPACAIAMRTGLALVWGTIAGLVCFVLPGILFLVVFGFALRSVADGARSMREAMRASLELVKARGAIVSELWALALVVHVVGLMSVVLLPVTAGFVAVVLSEGRERLFL
jgi:hypothetical protein